MDKDYLKANGCEHKRAKCINSRKIKGYRWRRHQCIDCGHRWSTIEVPMSNIKGQTRSEKIDRMVWAASKFNDRQIKAMIELAAAMREGE